MLLVCILGLFFFSACTPLCDEEVDRLNDFSYAFHYRDIDSVSVFAGKALALASDYPSGMAEAYNNLAFANIVRMEYEEAYLLLDSAVAATDNQVELLVADVQYMRLCQRESKNKDFYDYRERAIRRIKRITEARQTLSERMRKRFVYAATEFAIVCSTYYYYVGLTGRSVSALNRIDPSGEIQKDTAQYLNYLYQKGSGGMVSESSRSATLQKEFDYLLKCYILARRSGLVYWQANSLQAISEHLLGGKDGKLLMDNNRAAIVYLNTDDMPDSLLAGYLAQKSLKLFADYGDVYQISGAYRTLSLCYWALQDYTSSLICLENALTQNAAINKAPDLVASIREHLSIVYSAMDDKYNSDINRNAYLDIQDETRQDRQLEARAEQLDHTSAQLNLLIGFVLALIIITVTFLFVFNRMRRNKDDNAYMGRMLLPLKEWSGDNERRMNELDEEYEAAGEQLLSSRLKLDKYKRRCLDNKAKVFIVNNVVPYIDRILNEIDRLKTSGEPEDVRKGRYAYMAELTDKINEYNDVLTHWIQLQQGQLSLRIESFNLKDLFEILSKSEMSFRLKGVKLEVGSPDVVVKGDRVLTMFMLNTLADNARKFTPKGGTVEISADKTDDYVEISIRDTGVGISEDSLATIFDHKVRNGHGFGLMNCKGIIDKYKKISKIFSVCGIFAESEKGRGSRFYFRLPYGVSRCLAALFSMFSVAASMFAVGRDTDRIRQDCLIKAGAYADSAYYSNISGSYEKTLAFADSSRCWLNRHYKTIFPDGNVLMVRIGDGVGTPAEIRWFYDKVETNYDIILDIRNESAVAALALHQWDLYKYNNNVYTRLYKERSADSGLEDYCVTMQEASMNKQIAVVMLVLLLLAIFLAYYFLYYRHVLYFRFCADNVGNINKILLSDTDDGEKLARVNAVDTSKYPEVLQKVVGKIKEALERSVSQGEFMNLNIELVGDELRRVEYEAEKLYVSNNVIDNCLSALKHETMYYPSRIRQLVDNDSDNIENVSEVAVYYKELYCILCEQVRRQTDGIIFECKPVQLNDIIGVDIVVLGDKSLLSYLFDLLKKNFNYSHADVSVESVSDSYVVIKIYCNDVNLTKEQCDNMFTPSTENIPMLICRQIIRENAEQTNLHGCGITVERDDNDDGCVIRITLAKAKSIAVKNES